MADDPDRRAFFKRAAVGVGGLVGATLLPAVGSAARTKWWKYDGFTDSQADILSRAVAILADRVGARDTVANLYAVAEKSWTDDDYDTAIGLPATGNWNWHCMRYQMLHYLAVRVPHFHIRPYLEESDYWGRAGWGDIDGVPTRTLGTVLTHDVTNKTGVIKGEFAIEVNRHWLGSKGDGSDPEAWAGLLAHEMMHNLGHKHGRDEYGLHLQINAVQACVRHAGKYRSGMRCPPWRCGRL